MELRYYTPTIEEFHVGFEFETLEKVRDGSGNSSWNKWVLKNQPTFLKNLFDRYFINKHPENIRVKYLDKEDIESLGFERLRHKNGLYVCYGLKVDDFHTIEIQFLEEQSKIRVLKESSNYFQEFPTYLFDGQIKNKSELKKLLKQLNIYE